MTYILKDTEMNAALSLNAEYRYFHFLINAKKGLDVFILQNNNEPLFLTTDNDEDVLPIWCHENYAQRYAENNDVAKGYSPKSVSLALFLETWLPHLKSNNIDLAIFPVGNADCNIVSSDELLQDFNKDK
ncbi:MAG: DUF2750 domain-containing protein [Succinivibrionaceae bacterium]